MEYSPKKLSEKMIDNEFNFKKKYGQNFIIDEHIIDNIITKAEVDSETLVIEIGPGAGSLTSKLTKVAGKVIAYEIDKTLKSFLDEIKESNLEIIYQDFLEADVNEKLKKYDYNKIYVVANLPYYITTPIITKIIEDKIPVDKMVIMVQKEVGNRFKAKPNSKDYSSLSIYLNYYFEINKIMDVSKNVFMPKPNVDSVILELKKRKIRFTVKNEELFFKLLRDAFKQKRKTIKNNLINYNLELIEKILVENGFSLSSRAEQLPSEIFVSIANGL